MTSQGPSEILSTTCGEHGLGPASASWHDERDLLLTTDRHEVDGVVFAVQKLAEDTEALGAEGSRALDTSYSIEYIIGTGIN